MPLRSRPSYIGVEQHDGIRRVVVPQIVMHLLEVPAVLARLRLDRDHRDAEEVVAGPHGAVQIGAGVARREVDEPELGIDGRRLPDGRAAVFPRVVVARPRVVAGLARARDRIERPDELARARVVGLHAAAARAVAAREARDDEAVVVERRGRDAEAVLVRLRLDGPDDLARSRDRARRACRRADRRTPCRRRSRRRGSASRSR